MHHYHFSLSFRSYCIWIYHTSIKKKLSTIETNETLPLIPVFSNSLKNNLTPHLRLELIQKMCSNPNTSCSRLVVQCFFFLVRNVQLSLHQSLYLSLLTLLLACWELQKDRCCFHGTRCPGNLLLSTTLQPITVVIANQRMRTFVWLTTCKYTQLVLFRKQG